MAISLAQNAIALLIDLAERGEIDPWNVKVIEVIDRFLSKLQPGSGSSTGQVGRAQYESDLSESGQAFLYASMLLLLKADSLARQEADRDGVDDEAVEFLDDAAWNAPLPPNLERTIRRRAVSPPAQNRRVTLQELINQLNLMAAAMADPRPRRLATRRPRPQSRSQAIRAISQLAHQENLSEIAAILEQFLTDYWQDSESDHSSNPEANWLNFDELLSIWATAQPQEPVKAGKPPPAPPEPTVHDRVGVFWALLFLSSQSKVELSQEEFYQDLKVRKLVLDNPADTASGSDLPAIAPPD
jgi:segregation and condensation protein A